MIEIAICDDVASEREQFRSLLFSIEQKGQKWNFHTTEYNRGDFLLMDLEENQIRFDLIILDIYMEGMDGMETARKIRQRGIQTPLVFLTATPDFALESYDVHAFGYLLKPVSEEKLTALLRRLLAHYDRPRVCVQWERQKRYLFLDEIIYVESQNHTIHIHLSSGEVLDSKEKLGDLESLLDERFLRCHQSFLVNMSYIADVDGDFILKDGTKIPIRIRQRKAIAEEYYRFFVKHTLSHF